MSEIFNRFTCVNKKTQANSTSSETEEVIKSSDLEYINSTCSLFPELSDYISNQIKNDKLSPLESYFYDFNNDLNIFKNSGNIYCVTSDNDKHEYKEKVYYNNDDNVLEKELELNEIKDDELEFIFHSDNCFIDRGVDIDNESGLYDFSLLTSDIILDSSFSGAALTDRQVSREDRAKQKAVELIVSAKWPSTILPLVQKIFVMNGWGATRLALEREIGKGMIVDEFILAAHIKILWAENDYYWISYDKHGSSCLSQYAMSWPIALSVVRSFDSLPQLEELEYFIESLFEYWLDKTIFHKIFRSFNKFIWYRFSNLQGYLSSRIPFDFCSPYELAVEEYSDLGMDDPFGYEYIAKLCSFGVLNESQFPGLLYSYVSDEPLFSDVYAVDLNLDKDIFNED